MKLKKEKKLWFKFTELARPENMETEPYGIFIFWYFINNKTSERSISASTKSKEKEGILFILRSTKMKKRKKKRFN